MPKLNPNNPQHQQIRKTLRTFGPIILIVGLLFTIVGFASFFTSFGSDEHEPPRFFWCGFVGLPLMFVGAVSSQFGFIGAIARYAASEGAPVATDTFNYAADETKDGVRTIAAAVGEGFRDGKNAHRACARCGADNDADSRFCKACGAAFAQSA